MATNTTGASLYSSLSGADIHAVFGNYKFGSVQMIKYAISREKAPIFTLGSPSARATARGKRTVNGAFVFSLIDQKGLVKAMSDAGTGLGHIFLNSDEQANFANTGSDFRIKGDQTAYRNASATGGTISSDGVIGGQGFTPFVDDSIFAPGNFGTETAPYLADQMLPFDITIVGTPEYGSAFAKRLIIQGVEITTEASGTSIDDLVIEKQNAFIARNVVDWVGTGNLSVTGTLNRFATW